MRHTVEHTLPLTTLRELAGEAFEVYRQRYGRLRPTLRWVDRRRAEATVQLRGVVLRGRLELRPGAVVVEIAFPTLLRPLEGKARGLLERELKGWARRAAVA